MKYFMGIKNCHCCNNRDGCTLKNSEKNLTAVQVFKKIVLPKIKSVRIPTEVKVTSHCADFALEKHTSDRR